MQVTLSREEERHRAGGSRLAGATGDQNDSNTSACSVSLATTMLSEVRVLARWGGWVSTTASLNILQAILSKSLTSGSDQKGDSSPPAVTFCNPQ